MNDNDTREVKITSEDITFLNEVSLDKIYIEDKERKLENIYNFNRK